MSLSSTGPPTDDEAERGAALHFQSDSSGSGAQKTLFEEVIPLQECHRRIAIAQAKAQQAQERIISQIECEHAKILAQLHVEVERLQRLLKGVLFASGPQVECDSLRLVKMKKNFFLNSLFFLSYG